MRRTKSDRSPVSDVNPDDATNIAPRDRHILVGVSHPSDNPARHRTFEVRASYSKRGDGWVVQVAEQNTNEQRQAWELSPTDEGTPRVFPTPAAALGDAVTAIIAMVDRDLTDP